MKNVNQRRKYKHLKLAGDSGVIYTGLTIAVDRWSEQLGCTLKTNGQTDLVVANYETKVAKNDKRLIRKASSILTGKKEERPTGISKDG